MFNRKENNRELGRLKLIAAVMMITLVIIISLTPNIHAVNATKIQTFQECYNKMVDIMGLSGKQLDDFRTPIWNFCVS